MQKINTRRAPELAIQSRLPRYVQVASVLRQRIKDSHWAVGEKIATIEELEREFGVARVTVRQAIELLQDDGILKSQQGRGTFVTGSPRSDRWIQLATDWESLIGPLRRNVPEFLETKNPQPPIINPDDGAEAEEYVYLKSIQHRDDQPYAFARIHLARHIYEMAPKRFSKAVALVVLSGLKSVKISRAHQMLAIGGADVEASELLGISLGSPIVEARCVAIDADGVVIYTGEITYPGDLVRLNIELINSGQR